jgi:hypothetical protein
VTVIGRLRQGVLQASLDPFRAIVRDARRLGDRVGGPEADPRTSAASPASLVPNDPDGPVLVLLADPGGQGRRHARALEEDHYFLDGLLLLPGTGAPGALRLGARHLGQPGRLLPDDPQNAGPEMVSYPPGRHRADALDHPRAGVAANSLNGGGQHRRVGTSLELPAAPWMRGPPA